jgi:hypothetical protein
MLRLVVCFAFAMLSIIVPAGAQRAPAGTAQTSTTVVEKTPAPPPTIIVLTAGSVQVGNRRWTLKGFDAPRIEGARCQEERMRGKKLGTAWSSCSHQPAARLQYIQRVGSTADSTLPASPSMETMWAQY